VAAQLVSTLVSRSSEALLAVRTIPGLYRMTNREVMGVRAALGF
jgi:hypothetical protein